MSSPSLSKLSLLVGSLAALGTGCPIARGEEAPRGDVRLRLDLGNVTNTMRGGIGASWHAIEKPLPYSEQPDPVFQIKSHGGSGWGAYPAAGDQAAWDQIDRNARWLGLDFNRVEIEQRIYEPEQGRFTWDSPEMLILYKILDWCERNRADVFLQQMWSNVRWNAYPEWRDDTAGRLHSAPHNLDAFAEGLAALVEHLVRVKGYTCIHWLCITNEPGNGFSWWQRPPNKPVDLRPGLVVVRRALDARGLKIPLSGGDLTVTIPAYDPHPFQISGYAFDFHSLLGAYDFHSYNEDFDWLAKGIMAQADRNTVTWTAGAHREGKAFFLSEFGTMANGWGGDHPGPGLFPSVLKDAELVIRRLNAGVDGFNRWSFLNRGDLDGQWQFVETWDRKQKRLLGQFTPHPNTYFLLGLLTRFTAKHSDVLMSELDGGQIDSWRRVFAVLLRSAGGNLTLAVLNDAPRPIELSVEAKNLTGDGKLYRYSVSEADKDRPDLRIDSHPGAELSPAHPNFRDSLTAKSLTIYSTYRLDHQDDGITTDGTRRSP
jgi:hypothetical protein